LKYFDKIFSVCIYGLFLFIIFSPLSFDVQGNNVLNKIFYVDDENTQGPWDGSEEHPFQYIQDGVDATFFGDTVFVSSGLYHENVIVNKTIRLIGEDKTNTFIDVEGHDVTAVKIVTDGIELSGFTITNGTDGISLSDFSSNTICDNIITKNNQIGVSFEHSSENKILNNSISYNADAGIKFDHSSDNNLIDGNLIRGNGRGGIEIYHSSYNKITKNIISENHHSGIIIYHSANSTMVTDNSIEKNNYYGVLIGESAYNTVRRNNFINQSVHSRLFVTFKVFFEERNSFDILLNSWDSNYWDNWKFSFPKPISVYVDWKTPIIFIYISTYWVYFDRHPAQIPFDINE
jgi:parallel beta-helix repeat protein